MRKQNIKYDYNTSIDILLLNMRLASLTLIAFAFSASSAAVTSGSIPARDEGMPLIINLAQHIAKPHSNR